MSVFSLESSSQFARALAAGEGVRVKQERGNITPVSMKDGSILMGTPSIYNEDEWMGSLHREISKQGKDMRFFHDVDVEKNELQHAAKGIIQSMRTEFQMAGEYEGRDSALRTMYSKNVRDNGGMEAIVKKVGEDNKTLAAMAYIGNEIRNDWQGYNHCDCPPDLQDEVDRLSFLLDEWQEVNDKESLETLLHRVQYEEPPPPEEKPDDSDEGEDGEGDSSGSGGGSGETETESAESDGEPSEGDGSPGQDDQQNQDGSEGDDGGGGGSDGGDGDSSEGEGSSSGGEGRPDGNDEQPQDSGGTTDGQDEQADGNDSKSQPQQDNQVGACKGAQSLKGMGFQKDPIVDKYEAQGEEAPYFPKGNDLQEKDLTNETQHTQQSSMIKRFLGSFSLSRKIKKYLISQRQTGYQYGMKRGKICSKNVYRVKTGGAQPPIFKQKLASKIQTDTAMFLLGDCSGSMRGDRYITSAACQIAMSEVLQTLDIPHMSMQFSTGGPGRIHYVTRKFTERRVSRDTMLERYGSHQISMGCNADGEAVTAAAQYLAKMPQQNKILIVLSDGHPAYGSGGAQYLKDTVKEIEKSKVMDIIGIGIQTTSVEGFYKDSRVVNELTQLERVLLSLLKSKVMK